MSGELQIVFLYDTLRCRKEEDDPKDAILYFHPSDIPEERRICICGQLMGLTHFLIDSFASPQILTMENGKFALRRFGKQYVLALGCSNITPDWLLEKQADILYSLTKFFHRDIQSILTSSISSIMDHYIPVSQHHGDLFALTFGILPILYLPSNSANNISLQASLLLHSCITKKGCLGGIVMHQNKVVGVEINQDLAQKLAFIQPYQLPPAEVVKLNFKIPSGVQIFTVYVSGRELQQLKRRAVQFQHPASCEFTASKEGVNIDSIREEDPSDISSSIGFSEVSSSLYLEETPSQIDVLPSPSSSIPKCDSKPTTALKVDKSSIINVDDRGLDAKLKKFNEESKKEGTKNLRLGGFETCFDKRRSRSFESLSTIKEENLKKHLCSSLADPYFPYVLEGKPISKHFVESASNTTTNNEINEVNEYLADVVVTPSPPISPSPEPPIMEIPTINPTSTPSSIRRPINLPLNSLPDKNRRWSTFDDMMSPISQPAFQPATSVFQSLREDFDKEDEILEKLYTKDSSTSENPDSYTGELNDVVHLRMLNSFRKLSSHEDSSSFTSSSENEKTYCSSSSSSKSSLPSYGNSKKMGTDKKSSGPINAMKESKSEEPYEKARLFIYTHGSMRLLLILDGDQPLELNVIQALWEYGSIGVSELETSISNVEEQGHTMEANQSDTYCYLRYETIWKSLAHGGRNHSMDFDIVQLMHRDFTSHPNMSELIIRGEDHVVYGYQCVGSEVYYQQSANVLSGLPLASDLMGKVPLKAKRRLERDHSIILL